jgi:hypothetical protein
VTEVLTRGLHSWTSYYPDPRLNKIVVAVPEIRPGLLEDLITAIPSDALAISVQPGGAFAVGAVDEAARVRD